MKRLALISILLFSMVAVLSVTAVSAKGPTRQYIVISRSQFGVASSLLNQIKSAGGSVLKNMSRMGLVVVSSNNPNFARSVPGARAVAQNLRVANDKPRVVQGPTIAQAAVAGPPNASQGDPLFNLQWGITAVDAHNGWLDGRQGAGALVAVLDEGVDADHPDLVGQVRSDISTSFAEDCTGGIEDWNPPPAPPGGAYFVHGTHVAGIVAAAANGVGIIGVAPKAQILAVDVLSRCLGFGLDSWILDGIQYAADHGADVINMSLGSGPLDSRGACDDLGNCYTKEDIANLFIAYSYATLYANQHGTTVIASAGNEAFDFGANPLFLNLPSDALGILSISATAPVGWAVDPTVSLDNLASYSNFGYPRIDFAAPGGDFILPGDDVCTVGPVTNFCWVFDLVISDSPGGFFFAAGTSMASPHVSGVAAQYIGAAGGSMSPVLVQAALRELADHPNGNPNKDPFFGYGRVDATVED